MRVSKTCRSTSTLVQKNGWKSKKTTVQDDKLKKPKTKAKNKKSNEEPKKRKIIKTEKRLKYQLAFAEDVHECLVESAFLN